MNKTQSKKLAGAADSLRNEVHGELEKHKDIAGAWTLLAGKVSDAKTAVEDVRDEIGDKFDALSEKAQEGEKAQEMQTERDALDETVNLLEEIENEFQDDGLKELTAEEIGEKAEELQGKLDDAMSKLSEH